MHGTIYQQLISFAMKIIINESYYNLYLTAQAEGNVKSANFYFSKIDQKLFNDTM